MKLTSEQQALLDGSKGEVMAKVMKTLVMYGDTFGAERMVPVTSKYGHTVISYGLAALKPVLDLFDQQDLRTVRNSPPTPDLWTKMSPPRFWTILSSRR